MRPVAYELDRQVEVADGAAGRRVLRAQEVATPHDIPVDWTPLPPGVTDVEVTEASLSISARAAEESVPVVKVTPSAGGTFALALPSGVRARSLTLSDLAIGTGDLQVSLTTQGDLTGHDPALRLTVALPDPRGGFAAPTFAVPAVSGRTGVTPASLTGASFDGGVLTLPEPAGSALRVAVVTGDPGEFSSAPEVSLSKVSAITARYPTGLRLTADGAATLWEFPQELPPRSASQPVDIKPGLKKALLDKVKAGAAPVVTLRLDSAAPSAVGLGSTRIRGELLRTFPGTVRTPVAGAAIPLALIPPGAPAILVDGTTTVTADVTVKYDGIRLVRELSDPVPRGESSGIVIGADGARAALPPASTVLRTFPLARVGLIGRAPEPCELSVRLVNPLSGDAFAGDPVVVQLEAGPAVSVVWLAINAPSSSEPVAIAAHATRGRFFWATDAQGKPLVQIAVTDPSPPERTVSLGGRILANDLEPAHRAAAVVTAAFVAGSTPLFESAMFVTVDVSDVTVRYVR
jgi:hypothetical protein